MSVRAVIFDLDGTLVDSAPDIAAAVNHVLAGRGLDPLPEDVVEGFIGHGADELVRRAFAAAGARLEDQALSEETRLYLERYGAHPVRRSRLFRDAADALAALKARGVAVAVCTNKETELSWTVLRGLGVDRFVDVVVGADRAPRRKPDPAHLHAALAAVAAAPEEAVYVGDSAIDVRTAAAAGVPCTIVDWGTGRAQAGPECTGLSRFAELLDRTEAAPAAAPAPR